MLNLAKIFKYDPPTVKKGEVDEVATFTTVEAWKPIIEKLPPTWNDFKNYLKHKRKEMSVEDLIVRLQIEEDNKGTKKKGSTK
ncbi:hypothetical protein PVK06_030095 [Gossypium arboreum]|uniref:Uncharacterized protein n=1 Tax=Gossypium arboreum TaxID=29729 RepID=A0ABR0NMD3_GOSAR|nr:hypothetical protein PVK06_030095 [Gossypium arboreum]